MIWVVSKGHCLCVGNKEISIFIYLKMSHSVAFVLFNIYLIAAWIMIFNIVLIFCLMNLFTFLTEIYNHFYKV